MAINSLDRARIILDLIMDGNVANEAAYANVDKISAALGNKYAEPVYAVSTKLLDGNGDVIPYASLTNTQKGVIVVNHLREHFRQLLSAFRVSPVGQSAAAAEQTTVNTEVTTDLGAIEIP